MLVSSSCICEYFEFCVWWGSEWGFLSKGNNFWWNGGLGGFEVYGVGKGGCSSLGNF